MASVSVLITDQFRVPLAEPDWMEPETGVLACGVMRFVPDLKFPTERGPPEESETARLEPPVAVELVIVPLTPTVVPTRALVTPPVVIVKVVA